MEKHVPNKFAMLIHITKKGIKTITCSNYLANMNSIFVKLDVLKLKDIIAYKTYLLSLQSSCFVIKSGPYSMRYTNNFIGTIHKYIY